MISRKLPLETSALRQRLQSSCSFAHRQDF